MDQVRKENFSIAGFATLKSFVNFFSQVREVGIAMIYALEELVVMCDSIDLSVGIFSTAQKRA